MLAPGKPCTGNINPDELHIVYATLKQSSNHEELIPSDVAVICMDQHCPQACGIAGPDPVEEARGC